MLSAAAMCLATNIFFESRGEDLVGKAAIAEVTMNRVASPKYPNNVCDVVWQKKQFSWTHDGKHDDPTRFKSKFDQQAWSDSKALASLVLEGEIEFYPSGVTMYHADYVTPYWTSSYEIVYTIGKHKFYK
jgi:spore germination cell wall hydrolase CwlJ-like protein